MADNETIYLPGGADFFLAPEVKAEVSWSGERGRHLVHVRQRARGASAPRRVAGIAALVALAFGVGFTAGDVHRHTQIVGRLAAQEAGAAARAEAMAAGPASRRGVPAGHAPPRVVTPPEPQDGSRPTDPLGLMGR